PLSNTVTAAPRCPRRQAMERPMTPAPMTTIAGRAFPRFLPMAIGGSLRWNDPDRFDGFDLSRATSAAPQAVQPYDGHFRAVRQGSRRRVADARRSPLRQRDELVVARHRLKTAGLPVRLGGL